MQLVKRAHRTGLALLAVAAFAAVPFIARADIEVIDPQGRRVLLKDDGTWKVIEGAAAKDGKPEPKAELKLERAVSQPGSCTLELSLRNKLPYEIRTFVFNLAAVKPDDVVYRTQYADFIAIRPGDAKQRVIRFDDISCSDLARVKVSGGDRCEMGELNRFTDAKGTCLARVNVLAGGTPKLEK